MKKKFKVYKNETDSNVTEMYLYGRIGEPIAEEEETITDSEVRKALNKIDTDKIIIYLNSQGGDLFQAVSVHNMLVRHKSRVEIVIDAVAASGGAIIAMAGDKISMGVNATMVIHPVHTLTYADAKGHREVAKTLDEMDKSMLSNYEKRFKGTTRELKKLIDNSTRLTAKEALEKGLCDEVLDYKDDDDTNNRSRNNMLKALTSDRSKSTEDIISKYSKNNNKKKSILSNMSKKNDNKSLLGKMK
jgi:ATP-dependent protease ClpP protease subunit